MAVRGGPPRPMSGPAAKLPPRKPADEPTGGTDGTGSKRRTTKEEVKAVTEWFEMEETREEHDPLSGAVKTISTRPNYDWYQGVNQQDGVDGQKARSKISAQRELGNYIEAAVNVTNLLPIVTHDLSIDSITLFAGEIGLSVDARLLGEDEMCPVQKTNAAGEPIPLPDPPSNFFPFASVRPGNVIVCKVIERREDSFRELFDAPN